MPIDKVGIIPFDFIQKRLAFETVIFYCEKVLFINAAFGDDGATLTDFAAFIGDLDVAEETVDKLNEVFTAVACNLEQITKAVGLAVQLDERLEESVNLIS